ncbi:MAG: hypothetical protein IIC61_10020 [Proteobacteria bacterium]|nr:hypothetical protein [Pseudomonadota bacterium]
MSLTDSGFLSLSVEQALEEYLQSSPRPGMRAAEIYAWHSEFDQAFDYLEALEPGRNNFDRPLLRNLHDDPRWEPLVERLGRSTEERDAIEFDIALPSVGQMQNQRNYSCG